MPLTKDVYIGFKIATDMSFEEVDAFLERTARDPVHTWNFQHFSISQTAVFPGDADFQTVVAQEEKKLDAAEDEMANMVKQAKEWKKLDLAKRLEEGLLHMVSIRYRESGNISRATLHHMGVLGFGPDWRKCEAH